MPSQKRSQPAAGPPSSIDVPISIELAEDAEPPDGTAAACSLDTAWQQELVQAVHAAAQSQGFLRGQIGVLITDDPTIQQINQRHLGHDYPTDVISFPYQRGAEAIEGELVVSLCTARRSAAEIGCRWQSELLLYVIHGTLHICGLDDSTAAQRQQMRSAEQATLLRLGIRDAEALRRGFDQPLDSETPVVQR